MRQGPPVQTFVWLELLLPNVLILLAGYWCACGIVTVALYSLLTGHSKGTR
jgi:hypothetical protein